MVLNPSDVTFTGDLSQGRNAQASLEWRGCRLDTAAEDAPDGNNKAVEENTGGGNNNED